MKLNEKHFPLLDALSKGSNSQRQLAKLSGVSLGQVNFLLQSLLSRGLVKIKEFKRSPKKGTYAYLLTPRGLEAKSRLAGRFVLKKLEEYEKVRNSLAERLKIIEEAGHYRFVFVGPKPIRDLTNSVITEAGMHLECVHACREISEVETMDQNAFDIVLLCNGEECSNRKKLSEDLQLPKEKLHPLW
jgi:EPS-associated MarR family transcriptional regulator